MPPNETAAATETVTVAAAAPATATASVATPVNDDIVDKRTALFHWPAWQAGMWKGVGIALGIMGLLLIVLVSISIWRTTSIVEKKNAGDLLFIFVGIGIINNTLLRLLTMLIGAGIIFGGLAVSFFSSRDANQISFDANPAAGGVFKAMIASNTPGLIGMFLGGIIIVCALFATSTHRYESPRRTVITYGDPQSTQEPTEPLPPLSLPAAAEVLKEYRSSLPQAQVEKP